MNPQFPIYIISKSRWDSRYTVRSLEAAKVPFRVVIEEQEFKDYASVIDKKKLLILDMSYRDKFDPFWSFDKGVSLGSGPARNFVWDHSISEGHKWHWIMDDNINGFYRFNKNLKVPVSDGTIFRCMEDFCLRYENVSMAGPNYFMFAPRKQKSKPFTLNTRIYSCLLIRNDTPFRWRGRYNEDTDLSLRMLKAGWCTILFNAFLQYKLTTQTVKGGNTDAFYSSEGTLPKSKMIVEMHPDVCKLSFKFGRWHHHCDYRPFQANRLKKRKDLTIKSGVNNYGMSLKKLKEA